MLLARSKNHVGKNLLIKEMSFSSYLCLFVKGGHYYVPLVMKRKSNLVCHDLYTALQLFSSQKRMKTVT